MDGGKVGSSSFSSGRDRMRLPSEQSMQEGMPHIFLPGLSRLGGDGESYPTFGIGRTSNEISGKRACQAKLIFIFVFAECNISKGSDQINLTLHQTDLTPSEEN